MSIPHDDIYSLWLDKECGSTLLNDVHRVKVEMTSVNWISVYDTMKHWHKLNKPLCFFIVYPAPNFHIAAVLQRKKTVEYIDSMAAEPTNENPFSNQQLVVERAFELMCKLLDLTFKGSYDMYGNSRKRDPIFHTKDAYIIRPPQALENQFLGSSINRPGSETSVYGKNLLNYEGKDCLFWAHYIVHKLITKNISTREWAEHMNTKSTGNTIEEMGKKIAEYAIRRMTKDLARCYREGNKI